MARIIATQATTLTTASQAGTAFGAQTYQVRVAAPVGCYFRFDTTPTAVLSDTFLPANYPDYFTVTPGQKYAVLTTSTSTAATFSVSEMA